jgi:hypothetical protein
MSGRFGKNKKGRNHFRSFYGSATGLRLSDRRGFLPNHFDWGNVIFFPDLF